MRRAFYNVLARPRVIDPPGVFTAPTSIAYDGTADVGAALSSWMAATAAAASGPITIRLRQNGVYRIGDAAVLLDGLQDVTLDFQGATLRRTAVVGQTLRYPQHHGFLRLTGGPTNVTIRNLTVRGVNTNTGAVEAQADGVFEVGHADAGKSYLRDRDGNRRRIDNQAGLTAGDYGVYCVALEFEHAIDIVDGVNVIVDDCDLAGCGGDYVNTIGHLTDGVTVRNMLGRRNGRQGVACVAGSNFLVEGCDLTSRRGGIDMEPDTADHVMSGIEIRNNTLRTHLLAFPSGGPGEISDVNIHHNAIYKTGVPVHEVASNSGLHARTDYRFEDNTVHVELSSSLPLIYLGNVHTASIRRNVIPRTTGSSSKVAVGFHEASCSGIVVADNHFFRASPVVQDVVGGSTWTESNNSATSTPPPPSATYGPEAYTIPTGIPAVTPGAGTLQAAINAAAPGASFRLVPGTYTHTGMIVPKAGQKFYVEPSADPRNPATLIQTTGNAAMYAFTAPNQAAAVNDVEVYGGKWVNTGYFAQWGVIHCNVDTRSNLGIASGWKVHNAVLSGKSGAVRTGHGMELYRCLMEGNGKLGPGGNGNNVEMSYCEVTNNNVDLHPTGDEAGGSKFAASTGVWLHHNWFHDNNGPNVWFDINNDLAIIEHNLIEDSEESGIFWEISFGAEIRYNTIRRCNTHPNANIYAWGAGIYVAASDGAHCYGNVIEDCHYGIGCSQQNRDQNGDGQTDWFLDNVNLHDNTFRRCDRNPIGVVQDHGGLAVFDRTFSIENNTYEACANAFQWRNGARSFTTWRDTYGHDTTGTFTP